MKKKLDKTKEQLSGDETEKDIKHYVESLNNDPNWLKTITIEIYRLIMNTLTSSYKYICNGAKTKVLTHPSKLPRRSHTGLKKLIMTNVYELHL